MALKDPRQLDLLKAKKKPKYRNCRVKYEGKWFDSKKELERWKWLSLLQKNGDIRRLQRQVRFPLVVKCKKICVYVADFVYFDGQAVAEDAKGFRTQVYKLKKGLFEALYPHITFREV